jgi:hypothetical protein
MDDDEDSTGNKQKNPSKTEFKAFFVKAFQFLLDNDTFMN